MDMAAPDPKKQHLKHDGFACHSEDKESPTKLKQELRKTKQDVTNLKKKLKVSKQKSKRLKQKVDSLNLVVKKLKDKNMISSSCEQMVKKVISGFP